MRPSGDQLGQHAACHGPAGEGCEGKAAELMPRRGLAADAPFDAVNLRPPDQGMRAPSLSLVWVKASAGSA
eukprot:7646026-Lingulodinium_polyedra.AAC.1